jgi:acetyl-CoA acetyltransferase
LSLTSDTKNCAIVGIGEAPYGRYGPESVPPKLGMAVTALQKALSDAGLSRDDVDCLLSYGADASDSVGVASAMGMTLDSYADITGGGSSSEALITLASSLIGSGAARTVAIYRALHGYSGHRIGHGTGQPTIGNGLMQAYGAISAAQQFAPVFSTYARETGVTSEQVAYVRVIQSRHAASNPKAVYRTPVTVDDILNSRFIVEPNLRLYDCCAETDGAAAIIVTSLDRARALPNTPVRIVASVGRVSRQSPEYYYAGNITRIGAYRARKLIFDMAGMEAADIDVTAAYDCFTYSATMLLEAFGFCDPGQGGEYVSSGITALGGRRPNNTGGGQLCEAYTHGLNLVIENVRQLRWQADDSCPGATDGEHTHDHEPGRCRQVAGASTAMNMGWRTPATQSALILARE